MSFPANDLNRYVYVGGIADSPATASTVAGTLVLAAALTDVDTWTSVITAGVLTAAARTILLKNGTDICLEWSFDGGTTVHFKQLPGDRDAVDYRAGGTTQGVSVHVRRDTTQSIAASSGFATANAVM